MTTTTMFASRAFAALAAVALLATGCKDSPTTTDAAASDGSPAMDTVAASLDRGVGADRGATIDTGLSRDAGSGDTTRTLTRVDVNFTAGDGTKLTGYLVAGAAAGAPGVVLVHQYLQTDTQWGTLPETIARKGYRVFAFNLRGHGDSGAYKGGALSGILNDPKGAPLDVAAAIGYLSAGGGASKTRVAVVGTSIGANLAVVASIKDQAKTYVSFSARVPPVENLAGAKAATMKSVFYLAGERDSGGQARDAQTMSTNTTAPTKVHIYKGTADHGIAIIRNRPDATTMLVDWLKTNL